MKIKDVMLTTGKHHLDPGLYLVAVDQSHKAAILPISKNEAKAVIINIGGCKQ